MDVDIDLLKSISQPGAERHPIAAVHKRHIDENMNSGLKKDHHAINDTNDVINENKPKDSIVSLPEHDVFRTPTKANVTLSDSPVNEPDTSAAPGEKLQSNDSYKENHGADIHDPLHLMLGTIEPELSEVMSPMSERTLKQMVDMNTKLEKPSEPESVKYTLKIGPDGKLGLLSSRSAPVLDPLKTYKSKLGVSAVSSFPSLRGDHAEFRILLELV
ncbi:unnamed protein product [Owenia fusiformis]|uniref:Uncharacterized protein n=1 Tax=Owenia fusiformis TaxID=6347 RepID=A0A8S4N1L5_OWEFU|nr:unnamed protein product [Owenia fusiformis]